MFILIIDLLNELGFYAEYVVMVHPEFCTWAPNLFALHCLEINFDAHLTCRVGQNNTHAFNVNS